MFTSVITMPTIRMILLLIIPLLAILAMPVSASIDSRFDADESRIVAVCKHGDPTLYYMYESAFITWALENHVNNALKRGIYEVSADHWDSAAIAALVASAEAPTEIAFSLTPTE